VEISAQRVLLVVDDPGIREALAECLASAGFEVATAGDVQGGLEYIRERLPVAVLVGMRSPGPEGHGFQAAMRRDRRAAGIPVISLCGGEEARAGTAENQVLEKPFDLDEIARALHRISAPDVESAAQPTWLPAAGAARP